MPARGERANGRPVEGDATTDAAERGRAQAGDASQERFVPEERFATEEYRPSEERFASFTLG